MDKRRLQMEPGSNFVFKRLLFGGDATVDPGGGARAPYMPLGTKGGDDHLRAKY